MRARGSGACKRAAGVRSCCAPDRVESSLHPTLPDPSGASLVGAKVVERLEFGDEILEDLPALEGARRWRDHFPVRRARVASIDAIGKLDIAHRAFRRLSPSEFTFQQDIEVCCEYSGSLFHCPAQL